MILLFHYFRYGYADFSNSALAQKAMKALNETDLFGRNVRLDLANSSRGGGSTPRGRGKENIYTVTHRALCYVYTLPLVYKHLVASMCSVNPPVNVIL